MTMGPQSPLDDTTHRRAMQNPAPTGLRAWLSRLTEPDILYPAITILVIGVIWGGTFNLIRVEHVNTARTSAAATLELLDTYEAQIVRALREIDQTLKIVKYVYETRGATATLSDLKDRALLPPDLLFVVSVVSPDGVVVASTRPAQAPSPARPSFRQSLLKDTLWIDQPRK